MERSPAELAHAAGEVEAGRLPIGAFVADVDWALPAVARAGRYGGQSSRLIADALDRLATGDVEAEGAARALASAVMLSLQGANDSAVVGRVHAVLASAGLATGEPPGALTDRGGSRAASPAGTPAMSGEGTAAIDRLTEPDIEPMDPALDPEIEKLARSVAPSRSAGSTLTLMGLGWAVALSIVVGLVGGIWVDGQLGSSPIATIVGLLLGAAGAVLAGRDLIRQSRS